MAAGGAGILVLVAAAPFGRDPRAAKRLTDLISAWARFRRTAIAANRVLRQ